MLSTGGRLKRKLKKKSDGELRYNTIQYILLSTSRLGLFSVQLHNI